MMFLLGSEIATDSAGKGWDKGYDKGYEKSYVSILDSVSF